MNTTIAERLNSALETIQESARSANRPSAGISLLAVSKTKPITMIEQAYAAGQRLFGENYVQEGVDKIQQLSALEGIEWHLIGPLQSNKCKVVAQHFDWVQSIDRLKIATRLDDNRPEDMPPLNVCLQVNISGETTKSGMLLEELMTNAEQVSKLSRLRLRGIMAIPSNTDNETALAGEFHALHAGFTDLKARFNSVDTLSMGMSGDVALAIANGSTMVRVGTAIFGKRN